MMTDVGEAILELVRFLDREKVPTIDIAHECQPFLERITVHVERQACLWGVDTLRACCGCWRRRGCYPLTAGPNG